MDIELEIEGVIARPGECRITIAPSETQGEWDLGMLAPPSAWDLASFTAPVERLPDVIGHMLRERLALPHLTIG